MDFDKKLKPEIQRTLFQLGLEHEIYTGLDDALSNFTAAVAPIPRRLNTAVLGEVSLDVLGSDASIAMSQLFHQADQQLKVYWHVLACNYVSLLTSILNGLNRSEYTQAFLATRALVEHSAIAELRVMDIFRHCEYLNSVRPSEVKRAIKINNCFEIGNRLFDFLTHLNICFGAGRFNRDAFINHRNLVDIEIKRKDPRRQIGVMDAIDALDWRGKMIPATNPRYHYELLCDYVHPNVGANIIFVDEEEIVHFLLPGAREHTSIVKRETTQLPHSESMKLHTVQVIFIPLRETLTVVTQQLESLQKDISQLDDLCRRLREYGLRPAVYASNG